MHRRLRGRYAAAILLTLVGALFGAFLAWRFVRPLYRGTASIYIHPVAPGPRDTVDQSLLPLFESFLASEVEVIGTGEVTRRAVQTEVWQAAGGGNDADAMRSFEERRGVFLVPGTHLVRVEFVDPDPDVALAGVRAVIEAYQAQYAELHGEEEIDTGSGRRERLLVRRLRAGLDELQALTAEYGGVEGLEIRHRAAILLVLSTEEALRSVRAALGSQAPGSTPGALSPSEIAVESEPMAEYLAHLARTEAEQKILERRLGYTAPRVLALRTKIAVLQEGVDELARTWNQAHVAEAGAPTLAELEEREKGLQGRLAVLRGGSRKLGRIHSEARELQTANEELNQQLVRLEALEEDQAAVPTRQGRIQVADPGTRPTSPFRDARKLWAAVAAVVGGLLGFLIVLLTGLSDRRLKNAVAADDVLSHVRSLGLLPALPRDAEEGEGVRIATHFTHQVRTLLEIAHTREQAACICIAGPAVGSGATTLTAALGLSFATTGSRTLLVDADPAGRGLTRRVVRMLVRHVQHAGQSESLELLAPLVSPHEEGPAPEELEALLAHAIRAMGSKEARERGLVQDLFSLADLLDTAGARDRLALRLVDALAAEGELTAGALAAWIPSQTRQPDLPDAVQDGALPEHQLYRTGLDTLRFLPLPAEERLGATSVAMFAAILPRLRDQFDVVLVDAGRIPAADEASVLAVQSDAVVVVVSPEDQGPDAERALAHLGEIGARVAGVVFNRADQKDITRTGRTMYEARN